MTMETRLTAEYFPLGDFLLKELAGQFLHAHNDYEINDYEINDYEINDYKINDYKINDYENNYEINDYEINNYEINNYEINNYDPDDSEYDPEYDPDYDNHQKDTEEDEIEYDSDGEPILPEPDLGPKLYSQDEIVCSLAHKMTIDRDQGASVENLPDEIQDSILSSLAATVERVDAVKILPEVERKVRVTFKKSDFSKASRMNIKPAFLPPSSAEIQAKRELRESLRIPTKQALTLHRAKCRSCSPQKPFKKEPCQNVFRNGIWKGKCYRRECYYAHSKQELLRGNLFHLCHYDGGKNLCSVPSCRHRHSKLKSGCDCGRVGLVVDTTRFRGGSREVIADILCTCKWIPETLEDKPASARTMAALRAPQETPRQTRPRPRPQPGSWQKQGRRRR
jgi:hypothetical protein